MNSPATASHSRYAPARTRCRTAGTPPGQGTPPAAILRTAAYRHVFNPARAHADPAPRPRERSPGPRITVCRWPDLTIDTLSGYVEHYNVHRLHRALCQSRPPGVIICPARQVKT